MRSFSSLLCVSALPLILANCQTVQTPDDGKRWGEAELIENRPAGALRPQVAIDATGNAIAVWDQTDDDTAPGGTSDDIWSNRRDAEGQWGEAELLEEVEPDDALEAQIAVDGEGNAIVVFRQAEGPDYSRGFYRIWAVRHTPSNGWDSTLQPIGSNELGDASRPQIAVTPQGNAVVVWQQASADDETISIWANRFTAGGDWGGAVPVDTSVQTVLAPQIAIDADGNAIAVWERVDDNDGRSDIWSKHQTPAGDWTGAQPVEVDDRGNAWYPQVATDAEGNAIAVWQQQTDSERFDIYANRYIASTQKWGDWELIEREDSGGAERPQVAVDGHGNAIAVWVQLGGDRAGIWSNRYVAGVGWGSATPIGPTGLGSTRAPQVATDPDGNAVAVWVQFDRVDQDSVWANRYTAGRGWGKSQAIESNDEFRVQGPQVAMDDEGNAVAVWSQLNESFVFDVWSNHLSSSVSVE